MKNDLLLAFLSDARNYPEAPRRIEVRDTHMSSVFLTDRFAYKLKKHVVLDFLDYSTPEARHRNCDAEVRLNRRLAPSVYLDVIPVCITEQGRLHFGGPGRPIDWLVRMRRLPVRFLLDHALESDTPTVPALKPLINLLARFYRDSPALEISGVDYLAGLRDQIRHNAERIVELADAVMCKRLEPLVNELELFLAREKQLLFERAARVVDGHGDLRPEHLYFGTPPAVIDCIEFNRNFRLNDPLDELAFLDMECRYKHNDWIGPAFIDAYCAQCGDCAPPKLLSFYRAQRALLRAKLSLWHLADYPGDEGKWRRITNDYLVIASEEVLY